MGLMLLCSPASPLEGGRDFFAKGMTFAWLLHLIFLLMAGKA